MFYYILLFSTVLYTIYYNTFYYIFLPPLPFDQILYGSCDWDPGLMALNVEDRFATPVSLSLRCKGFLMCTWPFCKARRSSKLSPPPVQHVQVCKAIPDL